LIGRPAALDLSVGTSEDVLAGVELFCTADARKGMVARDARKGIPQRRQSHSNPASSVIELCLLAANTVRADREGVPHVTRKDMQMDVRDLLKGFLAVGDAFSAH